jgi:hypothetical protein
MRSPPERWCLPMPWARVVLLVCWSVCPSAQARQPTARETTVGMPGHVEQIVLPGAELEAVPNEDRRAPVILRVAHVFPHGSAFRYDLEYLGLEPGTFDLKAYLRRRDGSSTADLPSLPIVVRPLLPPGQVTPNPLVIHEAPSLGGYRALRIAAAVAWGLGLGAIVYYGFLRRKKLEPEPGIARPPSLADRLRPLVEGALAGQLSQPQLARLERTLIAFWRKRLGLEKADPAEAITALRTHPEAGPLLEQLELWLHRPASGGGVDPVRLLGPYQHLPPDALEGGAA